MSAEATGREAMARTIERYAGKTHEVEATMTPGGHRRFRFT